VDDTDVVVVNEGEIEGIEVEWLVGKSVVCCVEFVYTLRGEFCTNMTARKNRVIKPCP